MIKKELIVVAACIGVFTFLVGFSISRFSSWHDEGYTSVLVENSYSGIIERTALDVHPPLYYLLLKTWSLVFGDGLKALRSYSAVCMLAAILVTWRLLRKLYGVKPALVALVFMSVGPFLVRYGQEMRMYAQATLLASIATSLYVTTLQKKQLSRKQAVAYGGVIGAGMLTQYFFILVPLTHVIHALLTSKGALKKRLVSLKKYTLSVVVAALLFIPWLPKVISQYSDVYGAFWIGPVGVETLTSTPIAMTSFKKQFQMTGIEGLQSVLTLIALVIVFRQFYIKRKDDASRLLFLTVLLAPIIMFLLSVPPFQPSYQDRYMSFMSPLFYSVTALGLLLLVKKWARLVFAVCFVLVLGYGQWNNYWDGNNHGWQPKPYFTMNELIDQIDGEGPVYATSLWTYLDARTTLRNRGMAAEGQLLVKDVPTTFKGNWSVVYNRPELITTVVPQNTKQFWVIDETGSSKYDGTALAGYVPSISYVAGYGKITKYTLD